jgi:chaperonin GroEL
MKGENEDETIGIQIVKKALEAPLRTIANNAGVEGSVVLQRVMNSRGDTGYNARTDKFEDLKKAGVIDPTKVTRIALENAVSIASMVLTTECVINDKPEPETGGGAPGGMPGGMPGMM